MKKTIILFAIFLLTGIIAIAQNPNPVLIGYWQNWNDANAPYIQLDQIDSRYNIVDVAFAVPHLGTDYQMEFIPDQVSPATLIGQHARGNTRQAPSPPTPISAQIATENIQPRGSTASIGPTLPLCAASAAPTGSRSRPNRSCPTSPNPGSS